MEGYWVEDDQTFEEGFVPEYEDTFWTMDEYGYWSARLSKAAGYAEVP